MIKPIELRKIIKAAGQKILAHQKIIGEVPDFSKLKNKKIIFIWSTISYHFRHQRPQEWADRLSQAGYLVIYVENEFLTVRQKTAPPPFKLQKQNDNLWLLTLGSDWNYFIYTQIPDRKSSQIIEKSFAHFFAATKLNPAQNHLTYLVQQPFWWNFKWLSGNPKIHLIGEWFDWHQGFALVSKNLAQLEKIMIKQSHKIIVSSDFLRTWLQKNGAANKQIDKITNGVNWPKFAKVKTQSRTSQIIGYCGALENWFDEKLLTAIVSHFPTYEIHLIGKNNNPLITKLAKKYSNLKLIGEIDFSQVPSAINQFAVCLIPFKINQLTRATSPVKFFEYLALGKPVVSTDLPELRPYCDLAYLAKDESDFLVKVVSALNEANSDQNKQLIPRRKALAQQNSWQQKFIELERIIAT